MRCILHGIEELSLKKNKIIDCIQFDNTMFQPRLVKLLIRQSDYQYIIHV